MRLNNELNKNNKYLLNKKQIGFRRGLGCEMNILRMTENLRERLINKG